MRADDQEQWENKFFQTSSTFYFQPMREERKEGLVSPTKRLPNLTRLPVLSGCSRDVNTFFHLRIKKCALAEATFLVFSYRQAEEYIFHNFSKEQPGGHAAEQRRADMGVRAKTWNVQSKIVLTKVASASAYSRLLRHRLNGCARAASKIQP